MKTKEKDLIFSMVCPNGFDIHCEDNLTIQYVADRKIAEASGNLKWLVEKWKYVLPSLIGKEKIDDDVMVPPELLSITMDAKRFGVPEGVILFQTINAGVWMIDANGYVRIRNKKSWILRQYSTLLSGLKKIMRKLFASLA